MSSEKPPATTAPGVPGVAATESTPRSEDGQKLTTLEPTVSDFQRRLGGQQYFGVYIQPGQPGAYYPYHGIYSMQPGSASSYPIPAGQSPVASPIGGSLSGPVPCYPVVGGQTVPSVGGGQHVLSPEQARLVDGRVSVPRQQRGIRQGNSTYYWRGRPSIMPQATQILVEWFESHINDPYPVRAEKIRLAQQCNLTVNQVSYWFANKRVRYRAALKKKGNSGVEILWNYARRTGKRSSSDAGDSSGSAAVQVAPSTPSQPVYTPPTPSTGRLSKRIKPHMAEEPSFSVATDIPIVPVVPSESGKEKDTSAKTKR